MFRAAVLAVSAAMAMGASPSTCTTDLTTFFGTHPSCVSMITPDCEPGETLFDALVPSEICTSPCKDQLIGLMTGLEEEGCCTYDTLYALASSISGDSGCLSSGAALSFEGFADSIEYFCSNTSTSWNDVTYCFDDAQAYIETTGPGLLVVKQAKENNDLVTARTTFLATVNCTYVQEMQCCYKSMLDFSAGCGVDSTQLQAWTSGVQAGCSMFESVTLDFSSVCDGLPVIEECLGSEDPNCDGIAPPDNGDDDAAMSLTPLISGVFAAIFSIAFLARRV